MSGGKQTTNQSQNVDMTNTNQLTMDPQIRAQLGRGYTDFSNLYNSRIAAPLNLEYFSGYSTTPDAIVSNMLSRGIQDIKNQTTANNSSLANNLSLAGGDNTALLAALQHASKFNQAGAINSLIPSAMEQQRNFDIAKAGLINQNNQTQLAARGQMINELAPGLNLLGQLQQMGIATGKNVSSQKGTTSGTTVSKKSWF
jgi:hypothetical protein